MREGARDDDTGDVPVPSGARPPAATGTVTASRWRNLPGAVAVRDSKDHGGPVLLFAPDQWRAFTARVQAGDFDLG
jgi:hypothetical protein